jgi:hypothetical protein
MMAISKISAEHEGLLAGFHSSWQIVQHGSAHHLRLHLANLRTARAVCLHLAEEMDHLIKLAESKLEEHASLEKSLAEFEKSVNGRAV